MTGPESPAVQDTDRLREVAREHYGRRTSLCHDRGYQSRYQCAWKSPPMKTREDADAAHCSHALAAVLSVHREMVLGEVVDALDDRVKDAYIAERMGLAASAAPGMSPRWSAPESAGHVREWKRARNLVRRLATSAPPGSPPADERATAVEMGTVEPEGWMEASWAEASAIATEELRQMEARRVAADRPAAAVPGTGDEPDWRTEPAGKHVAAVQRWMALDLWIALGAEPADFETKVGASGWAETWATLLSSVRDGNTIRAALAAERDRLALDLQARDIAVREADGLRAQVEAERDEWKAKVEVLMLGDKALSSRIWLGEECARLRVDRATARAERDRLAETIRRAHLLVDQLNEQGTTKVTAAIVAALLAAALGDIPSPTAPDAPDRTEEQWTMRYLLNGEPQLAEDNGHIFDSRANAEQHIDAWRTFYPTLTYADVEYLRRTVTYGPWQPAPAEPEETDANT